MLKKAFHQLRAGASQIVGAIGLRHNQARRAAKAVATAAASAFKSDESKEDQARLLAPVVAEMIAMVDQMDRENPGMRDDFSVALREELKKAGVPADYLLNLRVDGVGAAGSASSKKRQARGTRK